jgi:FAD synthetase
MTSESLKHLKIRKPPFKVSGSMLDQVIDLAKGYVKDAKHYADRRKPVTSLACIAYAEGLLDALKYLELVDF